MPASAVPAQKAPLKADNVPLTTLTALRFVAAMLVFITHVDPSGQMSGAGRSGVSFFFLLSGFVLTWSARPGATPFYFWRRRLARLLPAYVVTWIAGIGVTAWESGWSAALSTDVIAGSLLLQAWFPATATHFAANGLGWSLSCEMFFYLLFPGLVVVLWRCRNRGLSALVAGALFLAVATPVLVHASDPNYFWTYIFPPTRLLEFVAGVGLAILARRGIRCPVPLPVAVAIAALAWVLSGYGPAWTSTIAIMVVPWALLVAAAASADLRGSPIRCQTAIRLGEWSYAFYLVHQLALRAVAIVMPTASMPTRFALGLALSLGLAGALHVSVERPARRLLLPG